MEVMHLAGYILQEKLEIATRFVVPRELSELSLKRNQLSISKAALRELIDGYAREAGLRTLEKQIRKIVRKSAVTILEQPNVKIRIGPKEVHELLGKRTYSSDATYPKPKPGVVLGLAWTSHGGDTLFIEATAIPSSRPGLKQTGQLGNVMLESSEIAYTVVRGACAGMETCERFFGTHQIHLHVPAGATPKDGPSAGITMATALYTLCRGRPIRLGFAMTGELDLRGEVLPVGGIREKVIAAKRAKVRQIILPKDNEADFERLPAHVKKGLTAHFVGSFDEVVALCVR
jgi:ATP-dependent Lon protease